MQALLTVDQLSACLQKSVASIRSDATRNPQALPPICRLPGTKRLLWRLEDVETWLAEHEAALRALFAGDAAVFGAQIAGWPEDIRDHALHLAGPGLAGGKAAT